MFLILISFSLINILFAESLEAQYQTRDFSVYKKTLIELESNIEKDPSAQNLAYLSLIYTHFSYRDWHFGRKGKTYIEQAYKFAKQSIAKDSKNFLGHKALGAVYLISGNKTAAKASLKKSTELNSKDAESWYLFASASTGSIVNEGSEAGKLMKKALEIDSNFEWALEDIVMVFLSKGDIASANRTLNTLRLANSSNSQLKFYEGKILLHSGKRFEARTKFEDYIRLNEGSNLANYLKLYLAK